MQRILVTGANGFVGVALIKTLVESSYSIRATVRNELGLSQLVGHYDLSQVETVVVGEINGETDWSPYLKDIDCVVHLAARVHVLKESSQDPLISFRKVNVEGTRRLAEQAAQAGVRRFIFMSSLHVHGKKMSVEQTAQQGLDEEYAINPETPYGVSKWEAEQALKKIAESSNMEYVIIRPPLIYGPGVGANFLMLMRLVNTGIPIPLGSLQNRRSFVFVDNLTSAIEKMINHPQAAAQTYLISDNQPVSTGELIKLIRKQSRRGGRLIPFPVSLIRLAGRLLGRSAQIDGLLGSLWIDTQKAQTELDWQPPYNMETGVAATVDWFNSQFLVRK